MDKRAQRAIERLEELRIEHDQRADRCGAGSNEFYSHLSKEIAYRRAIEIIREEFSK